MKNQSKQSFKSGFTLVELLVVIAIIAVLAAAGFAGGRAAMQKAREVSAQATATSLVTAIDQYFSEYSALPDVGSSEVNTATQPELLNILAGLESGTDIQNARKIRFLSLKEAKKGKRDGLVYDGTGDNITGLYDPWGEPYYVVMDDDFDEKLQIDPQGSPATTLNGRRVAVYSLGTDKPSNANSGTLVTSW